MKVKLETVTFLSKDWSKGSGLPFWAKKSYLVIFKLVETSKWSKFWNYVTSDSGSYLYILRPLGTKRWRIYSYGSDHFRCSPYPHYLGEIKGSSKPEIIAQGIPKLQKRPFEIIK